MSDYLFTQLRYFEDILAKMDIIIRHDSRDNIRSYKYEN